jgi:hypothetical protein
MTRRFPRLFDRIQGVDPGRLRAAQDNRRVRPDIPRIRFRFTPPNFPGINNIDPQPAVDPDEFRFPNRNIPDVRPIPPAPDGFLPDGFPQIPDVRIVDPIPGVTTSNSSETDKKRKIIVSQNRLDPLSNWCFSRAKYGDKNRVKYLEPLDNSPNLRVGNPDSEASPNIEWSLAPFGNGTAPPRQTNISTLSSFLAAVNPSPMLLEEHYRNLFYRGNPYISVGKPFHGSREPYRSMAAEMLSAMLETSERIIGSLSIFRLDGELTNFQRQLNEIKVRHFRQNIFQPDQAIEDPKVSFFFSKLNTLGEDVIFGEGNLAQEAFDLRESIKERVAQRGSIVRQNLEPGLDPDISMLTIITELLMMVAEDPISRDREKVIIRHVIADVMAQMLPAAVISEIQIRNTYEYLHDYVEFNTPYITNRNTHQYLEGVQNNKFTAKAISDYRYYAKDYEQVAEDSRETLLPNIYAMDQYISLSKAQARNAEQELKLSELGQYLSLGDQLSDYIDIEAAENGKERYYNLYAKALKNIVDEDLMIWDAKNSSVILESSRIRGNQLFNNQPPMSIGLEFVRSDEQHIESLIHNPDLELEHPDFRETMFQNIDKMPSTQGRTEVLYATEYLQGGIDGIIEKESGYTQMALRKIPFADVLTPQYVRGTDFVIDSNIDFASLVVNETGEVTSQDELGVIEELIHNHAEIVSHNSYAIIVNAQSSPSDALGYRIDKQRDNMNLQSFYLGNGAGPRRVTYTDNQIKYDEEYSYDLYEYRLIFGTKYNFDVLGSVPVWLLQYYLGLRRGPLQRQLNAAPNVSFKCYAKTFAEYGVVEIPIYREDLEPAGDLASILSGDPAISSQGGLGSISYPLAKVLDYPPMAPNLSVFPLLGNNSQVKLNMSPQTGQSLGSQAQEIVSIGDRSAQIDLLKTYQDNFKNIFLPPNKLEFRNEGLSEIKCVTLYRTTSIDFNVENYNDLYSSFNPQLNPDSFSRTFTTRDDLVLDEDFQLVLSYDILEDLQPNINYYYTCVVKDVHNNPSNPSIIYRVRLLLDKGLLIPEVELVKPLGNQVKEPSKNLTRFIQIEASNIQTAPVTGFDAEGGGSSRSLGKTMGRSIEDQSYIIRLTSKDTGRKFDIKLNFVVRLNGEPINVGT